MAFPSRVSRVVCLYIVFTASSLVALVEGKHFTFTYQGELCAMIDVDLNLTVSAWREATPADIHTVTRSSETSNVEVIANCATKDYVMLQFEKKLKWSAHLTAEVEKPYYSFQVTLHPKDLFPSESFPDDSMYIFDEPNVVGLIDSGNSSYKCSNHGSTTYNVQNVETNTGDLKMKVAVDIRSIQVQVHNVRNGRYSPAGVGCRTKSLSKASGSIWDSGKVWIIPVVVGYWLASAWQ